MSSQRGLKEVIFQILFVCCLLHAFSDALAQSPELLLREFASGQIKKGVRSIGMGGNGATWGNYSLTWRDSSTALLNGGVTSYTNSNRFSFTAVGVTTPTLKNRWVIYAIALSQYASNVNLSVKSPALGPSSTPVYGDGSNQAVFMKVSKFLGRGWSFGLLFSYERSQFSVNSSSDPTRFVRYQTNWLPSGGVGLTWQPNNRLLVGFRGLFNHDLERRIDNVGVYEGLNLAHEYRLGFSWVVWKGGLIDIGGNMRYRYNEISNTRSSTYSPNIGFEQNLLNRKLAFRFGLDESSPTGGLSIRMLPIVLDIAYVRNLGKARLNDLFGNQSNSILATLVYNYQYKRKA